MQRQQQRAVLDGSPSPEVKRLERSQERVQAFFPDMRQVRNRALAGLQKQMKGQLPSSEPACLSPESSKRLKRKLNRKKRRKRMQVLKQGINQLKGIFEKIYYMGCTFDELREDIELAIQKIPSEGEFVDRLNQLIRDYVEDTCDYLLEERGRFSSIEGLPDIVHPQSGTPKTDQRSFEVDFVTVVYEEFYVIKTSSEEIDKMIELYYEQSKGANPGELTLKESKCPLYKSTFIYMMNHQIKLKKWLNDTNRLFRESDMQDQEPLAKLEEMLSIIYEYSGEGEPLEETDPSTADSDERCLELQHCKPKKKHVNAGLSDEQFGSLSEETLSQQLVAELQRMQLKGPRLKCDFDKEWLRAVETALLSKH